VTDVGDAAFTASGDRGAGDGDDGDGGGGGSSMLRREIDLTR